MLVETPLYYYRIHHHNSFAKLKVEQYLEPQMIYWHYFTACNAGYNQNIYAPNFQNWPEFFDQWSKQDDVLAGALFLTGQYPIKYDRLAQSINQFT
jgi:hypothetical protein